MSGSNKTKPTGYSNNSFGNNRTMDRKTNHNGSGVKSTYVPKGSNANAWAQKSPSSLTEPSPNGFEVDFMNQFGVSNLLSHSDPLLSKDKDPEPDQFLNHQFGMFSLDDRQEPTFGTKPQSPIQPPQSKNTSRFMTQVFGKESTQPQTIPSKSSNSNDSIPFTSHSPFETGFAFDLKEAAKSSINHPKESEKKNILTQQQEVKTTSRHSLEKKSIEGRERKVLEKSSKSRSKKLSLQEFYTTVGQNQDDDDSEEPCKTLWVGNIGPEVTEQELEVEFSQFGKLESLRILHDRFCAFVNFEEEEAAKEAKKNLQGTIIGSQYILINYRKNDGKPNVPTPSGTLTVVPPHNDNNFILNSPSRALWIGNISDLISEEDLTNEFGKFGPIDSIRLLRYKTCAFVNFMRVEDAQAALQSLQGKQLGDMPIKINFGKPQPPPQRSKENLESPPQTLEMSSSVPMPQQTAFSEGNSFTGFPFGVGPTNTFQPQIPYLPSLDLYNFFGSNDKCDVCSVNLKETAFFPCNHSCCQSCLLRLRSSAVMSADKGTRCPVCKLTITRYVPLEYSNFSFLPPDPQVGFF